MILFDVDWRYSNESQCTYIHILKLQNSRPGNNIRRRHIVCSRRCICLFETISKLIWKNNLKITPHTMLALYDRRTNNASSIASNMYPATSGWRMVYYHWTNTKMIAIHRLGENRWKWMESSEALAMVKDWWRNTIESMYTWHYAFLLTSSIYSEFVIIFFYFFSASFLLSFHFDFVFCR